MPVPDYQSIMLPLLQLTVDGEQHGMRDLTEKLAADFRLSQADLNERIQSGQARFANRVDWVRTYTLKAGLLASPERGVVGITPRGREVLDSRPAGIDNDLLAQFKEFRDFKAIGPKQDQATPATTPMELLDSKYSLLRRELARRSWPR